MKLRTISMAAFAALLITGNVFAGGHGVHWTYEGEEGPAKWGSLCEDYATCMKGKHQSPINITHAMDATLENITFSYKANKLDVSNNGHTIQANMEKGNTISIDGDTYELLQLHFHSPSEHQFDGKNLIGEMHLVHKSTEGKLAVVGVLIEQGKKNTKLAAIWDNMPAEKDEHITNDKLMINPSELLPVKTTYSRYSGSLTTPPCSEEVKWFVMSNTITMSEEQLEKFEATIGENNRPVQAINDRMIKQK